LVQRREQRSAEARRGEEEEPLRDGVSRRGQGFELLRGKELGLVFLKEKRGCMSDYPRKKEEWALISAGGGDGGKDRWSGITLSFWQEKRGPRRRERKKRETAPPKKGKREGKPLELIGRPNGKEEISRAEPTGGKRKTVPASISPKKQREREKRVKKKGEGLKERARDDRGRVGIYCIAEVRNYPFQKVSAKEIRHQRKEGRNSVCGLCRRVTRKKGRLPMRKKKKATYSTPRNPSSAQQRHKDLTRRESGEKAKHQKKHSILANSQKKEESLVIAGREDSAQRETERLARGETSRPSGSEEKMLTTMEPGSGGKGGKASRAGRRTPGGKAYVLLIQTAYLRREERTTREHLERWRENRGGKKRIYYLWSEPRKGGRRPCERKGEGTPIPSNGPQEEAST